MRCSSFAFAPIAVLALTMPGPLLEAGPETAPAAEPGQVQPTNTELRRLYEEDQADRQSEQIDWSIVGPRDVARRKRVYELIAAGSLREAKDYFHAAMVLQHGDKPDDFAKAHELALRAAELDPSHRTARWLAAAAKDRHLHSLGQPQIYGTQFRRDGNGPWTLDPIDETAVTDEERARWGVPPLAEAKKRLKEMQEK